MVRARKSTKASEKELWDRTRQYETIREQAEDSVKNGKISKTVGELIVRIIWRCDRISDIFDSVYDSPSSYFTAQDLEQSFEVLTWNEGGPTNNKPIYFRQMPLHDFEAFTFDKYAGLNRDSFYDPDNPGDFMNGLSIDLRNYIGSAWDHKNDVPLYYRGNWYDERYKHSAPVPVEYEELWEPESQRYGWIAPMISGKNGVPHTIAKVENKCRKGDRILRSELLTILRIMFWKGMTVTGSRHGVNPVLIISMSYEVFHIIEAYMNGPKIVLRYSDPLPFTLEDTAEQQEETMRYVTRWIMADAIGDTRSFDAIAAVVPPLDLPHGDN